MSALWRLRGESWLQPSSWGSQLTPGGEEACLFQLADAWLHQALFSTPGTSGASPGSGAGAFYQEEKLVFRKCRNLKLPRVELRCHPLSPCAPLPDVGLILARGKVGRETWMNQFSDVVGGREAQRPAQGPCSIVMAGTGRERARQEVSF